MERKNVKIPRLDLEEIRKKTVRFCYELDLAIVLLYERPDPAARRIAHKLARREIVAPLTDTMLRVAHRRGFELNAAREGEAWRIQDRADMERLMLRMDEVACTVYRRCAMRTLETNGVSVKAIRSYTDKDKSLPRLDRLFILAELLGYTLTWFDAMNGRCVNAEYNLWAYSAALAHPPRRRKEPK
jgi:hypothetical protein